MYQVLVFYPGDEFAHSTFTSMTATQVLDRIQSALAEHPQCERLDIRVGTTRLFSVDCAGNRLP